MKFNLKVSEIKAGLLICSKDETRFVLCGIHVELKPKQQPLIVATDGRRMIIINSEAPQEFYVDKTEKLTITAEALNKVLRVSGKAENILFEREDSILTAHIIGNLESVRFGKDAIISGNYPNWRKTIPKEVKNPISEIGFNAVWAGDFSKASKILGADGLGIRIRMTDEQGAFLVRSQKSNFLGILMPCLVNIEHWNPLWIGVDEESAKPSEPPKPAETVAT